MGGSFPSCDVVLVEMESAQWSRGMGSFNEC